MCSQNQPGLYIYARSDFLHPFQFHFSTEGMDHIALNQLRSNLDSLVRAWQNTSGLEGSQCAGIIGPGFWQDATSPLPVSHFQTWFRSSTDVLDNTVQNQPRSNLVLVDCVRFWPNRSSLEASQCARIIHLTSGLCFPADLDWIWIRSGMFTGYIYNSTASVYWFGKTVRNETETHPCKSCKNGQLDLELAESNLIYGLFHSVRLWWQNWKSQEQSACCLHLTSSYLKPFCLFWWRWDAYYKYFNWSVLAFTRTTKL